MSIRVMIKLAVVLLPVAATAAAAEDVVVGAQFPLSAPMASYSVPFLRQGAETARDRMLNEQVLGPGRTLKLLLEDNAGDRNQAISLMNRFASSDNVLAAFGVDGSFNCGVVVGTTHKARTGEREPRIALLVSFSVGGWREVKCPETRALRVGNRC